MLVRRLYSKRIITIALYKNYITKPISRSICYKCFATTHPKLDTTHIHYAAQRLNLATKGIRIHQESQDSNDQIS